MPWVMLVVVFVANTNQCLSAAYRRCCARCMLPSFLTVVAELLVWYNVVSRLYWAKQHVETDALIWTPEFLGDVLQHAAHNMHYALTWHLRKKTWCWRYLHLYFDQRGLEILSALWHPVTSGQPAHVHCKTRVPSCQTNQDMEFMEAFEIVKLDMGREYFPSEFKIVQADDIKMKNHIF